MLIRLVFMCNYWQVPVALNLKLASTPKSKVRILSLKFNFKYIVALYFIIRCEEVDGETYKTKNVTYKKLKTQ